MNDLLSFFHDIDGENMESKELAVNELQAHIVPVDATKTIEIKNLVVSPMPRLDVALGTSESFVRMTEETSNVKAVIWNEGGISLLTDDRSTSITFFPELRPEAAMFFGKHDKKQADRDGNEIKVWEGDYQPVQFSKRNLIKFIEKYSAVIEGAKEVSEAVKKMNVKEVLSQNMEMLDMDSDNVRSVVEETVTSNVPKAFKMNMNLAENIISELHFQVDLARKEDRYGNPTKDFCLVLRCTNAREIMRDMMFGIVSQLPESLPKYYGAMRLGDGKKSMW